MRWVCGSSDVSARNVIVSRFVQYRLSVSLPLNVPEVVAYDRTSLCSSKTVLLKGILST
jgi:hypothetical protein